MTLSTAPQAPELVIFIGLQASGKSTFYARRFSQTHVLVSKDLMRNNRKPERRQRALVEEALEAGKSVAVDNTNPGPSDRAALIEIAKRHGARIVGYYFESRVKECLSRNRQRSGRACVPDVALYATLRKLEPPRYDEGFDRLYAVRIAQDGTFAVRTWNEKDSSDSSDGSDRSESSKNLA